MRFIRSKKWQVFSTSVPPVLAVSRFQSPTLVQEREAVLAHRDHPRRADHAAVDEPDQLGGRRHVPVLEADPRDRRRPAAGASSSMSRSQSATVVHSGFSTSAWRSVARTSATIVDVGVVRRDDDHGVAQPAGEQVAVVGRTRATSAPAARGAGGERPVVGVGDRRDRRAVERRGCSWMCSMPIIPVPMTP